jgi:hypothetical protein
LKSISSISFGVDFTPKFEGKKLSPKFFSKWRDFYVPMFNLLFWSHSFGRNLLIKLEMVKCKFVIKAKIIFIIIRCIN